MQSHEDYRANTAQLGSYASSYHLVISQQNSTHDISKALPAASSGMYAPNAGAGPQHHPQGQPPVSSMVPQQQMNHRPMMMNNLQGRPTPPMQNISRNAMSVSQAAPQGPPQQYSHLQNMMLQTHHNMHTQSMNPPAAPMLMAGPHALFFQPRPIQYQQQPFYVTQCYPNYNTQHAGNAYYPMPTMPSCPPAVNNTMHETPAPAQKRVLSIINPKTGENVLDKFLNQSKVKDVPRSGGSDAAVKFASQVAAAAASTDAGNVHSNEELDESLVMHLQQRLKNSMEKDQDSETCEASNMDMCEEYVDDANSRDTPSLSYSDKDSLEVNNSISDSIPNIPDSEQIVEVLPDPEVVPTHSIVNHDLAPTPPDYVMADNETPEEVPSNVVHSEPEIVQDMDSTNCTISEKEFPSLTGDSSSPSQSEAIELECVSPPSDASSNKYSDVSSGSSNALKTDKIEGKKSKSKKKKDLNKKGESKEGSEMDAFSVSEDFTPTPGSPLTLVETPLPILAPQPTSTPLPPVQIPNNAVIELPVETIVDRSLLNLIPLPNDVEASEEVVDVSPPIEDISPDEKMPEKKDLSEPALQDAAKTGLKYEYKEDQWSPLNPEGKKQYDRDFLIKLQQLPMSLKKPENLPNLEVIRDKAHLHKLGDPTRMVPMPLPNRGISGNFDLFCPQFLGGRPGSQRPPHPGVRRSQQGREKPPRKVVFSSSLNQSVKLHESENAWKPARPNEVEVPVSTESGSTEELYKKIRGILNKLTPQKFDTLVEQVKELEINTVERLNGVIDLVFEKAIDEPNFSVPYAMLCKQLVALKVPSADQEGRYVNFRKLLLTKCQKEFEMDKTDKLHRTERMKQIEECDKDDKRKLLQDEFNEEETKNRRRQLGNIRFIGELFKLKMLIEPIMHECIKTLLNQVDEDSLECLCRLLTTIGKELETRQDKESNDEFEQKKAIMNGNFHEMQRIVEKRKTSSRVRFMLQDVIDLRKDNWVPRRGDNNPKTIDQIHQEAEREIHEQQQLLQNLSFSLKRQSDDPRKKNLNQGRNSDFMNREVEAGWTITNRSNKTSFNQTFDPTKLKNLSRTTEVENIQLGPGAGKGISGWGRGSSGGYKQNNEPENKPPAILSNRYMALAEASVGLPMDTRRGSQRSAASSRESSRGRSNQMSPMMRKTPSVTKDRENALEAVNRLTRGVQPEQKVAEPAKVPDVKKAINGKASTGNATLKGVELSLEDIEKKTKPLIDEFLHNSDFEEAIRCITELASPNTMPMFIAEAVNQVLERSSQARFMFGRLLQNLVKSKILSMEQYNKGMENVLKLLDDLVLDIPKIAEYLGEIMEPMIEGNSSSLRFLEETLQSCTITSLCIGKVISSILHNAVKTRGEIKVCELWTESGLKWSAFLPEGEDVSNFLELEKLEFTVRPVIEQPKPDLSIADIKEKLDYYLNAFNNNEEIFDWVESNVGEARAGENAFVRALVTAVFENAIDGSADSCELCSEKLKNRMQLFTKYVRTEDLQLQALYAVQALVTRLAQPKGVLRAIFDHLYDDDIVTEWSFKRWEESNDPAEQEGKGVAKASVSTFFTWLREGEDESEEG